ncbi:MAG: SDR family oxidoreductase [Gammaproteobacteria bacterium]
MSSKEFTGRVALVTGGSRGIGRAVSLALAREGAAVAINYASNDEAARRTQRELEALGARCALVKADVADPEAVAAMMKTIEATLGPVDLLVTSAGVAHIGDHTQLDFATWQRILRINVDGTYLPVMAVKDGMIRRGYGRIVCVASIAGLAARPHMIPYSVSKAAVVALVRSCAAAFAPQVRMNGLAPGLIETDMSANMDPALKRHMAESAMLKRTGQPEEMAETILFLLSERSSFTTGQTLVADGGRVTLP